MAPLNIRKYLLPSLSRIRGINWYYYYHRFQHEDNTGIHPNTTKKLLRQILFHCHQSVPYYREIMSKLEGSFDVDPFMYLQSLPVLTKDIIRSRFDEMKSDDLNRRKWRFATTGGSTGESLRFIADYEHSARVSAVTAFFSKLIGIEVGESELFLWGSPRELKHGTSGWKAHLVNKLNNSLILSAFQMTPKRMKDYISIINTKKPKLIVAYADALYELAHFAEREGIEVLPQNVAITSAGMLYPYMRQKIEKIFHCQVFDRYGSTEFGTIACERPDISGYWIPPWTIYLEIVDARGNRVAPGMEGNILVTCLSNYAMPLIRYKVGDRGVLSLNLGNKGCGNQQILKSVLGRNNDIFKTKNGTIVHASFFAYLLYHRNWVRQYQVIQKSLSKVIFRIVKVGIDSPQNDLDEFTRKTQIVMGEDCEVIFEFVDRIPASNSGKFRYIICELDDLSEEDV
jgi:phenylacetate-CoA ligase